MSIMPIQIVNQTEYGLIERFGKFNRGAEPGLNIIIPFIEGIVKLNTTEQMVDAEPQEVITKDNLNARVDAQVYYRIIPQLENVKRARYNVNDYEYQIVSLARTTLRNIIGKLSFKEVNSMRGKLNTELGKELDSQTKGWGIQVVRTELMEIKPPVEVQDTMNKVIQAENTKTAALDFATATETEADGKKRAAIKEAEGKAQASILEATGKAKATVTIATGEAEAIKKVNDATRRYFKGQAVQYKKLETAQIALKDNTKVIVPEKSNLVNLIGELSGLKGNKQ